MKKTSIIIMWAALLAGALLTAGCNKAGFIGRGGQITFGTVAGEVGTKTAYGNDFPGGDAATTYQYINWLSGDYITIVSAESAVDTDGSGNHFAN